jgi:hypothetical protein
MNNFNEMFNNNYNTKINNSFNNIFTDGDIDIFLKSYEENLLEGISTSTKIPVWVEYLKTKKYYRKNGLEEDFFFNKRFNITNEDLINLQKIMNRVREGKKINRINRSNVQASGLSNSILDRTNTGMFSEYDENKEIQESDTNKFELLSQVSSAMDDYYKKMKKAKDRKLSWKNGNKDYRYQRELALGGSIQDVSNPYYIEQEYNEAPQYSYDVQEFAKSPLGNMNKTSIINRIDEISNILDKNNLLTTDFENGRSVPVVLTNKQTYSNNFDKKLINEQLKGENYMGSNTKHDPVSARFWQDQDILNPGSQTRKTAIKNKQPFENQFQYLDCNYNRVEDPRLIGQASRMDNRARMER